MAQRTTAEEIEHRLKFERLVLGISTAFINLGPAEIDAGIEQALARIGIFCDVDRAYVFRLGEEVMINTHEWCAAGVEPQIGKLKALPFSVYPWWMRRILRQEVIHIPSVADLPDEASAERRILFEQDVVSIVVVPMVLEGKAIGFIGFDSIRREKCWTDEDITLLRIAGEIFVNALERKRAEEQRIALEEELIQARSLENVGRLAGGVAHDFNNLLMVIISHAQTLKSACTDPALEHCAEVLVQTAQRAAQLTRQLTIVGRREMLPSETLDVNAVLFSLEALLQSSLGESIELTLELDPAPCWIELSKAHLEQVIVNLTVNARDALPNGGRVLIQTLGHCAPAARPLADHGEDGFVCLRVSDNGMGMSEEVRRRAFEPFFSTKGPFGTGLGLSTLQSIVQRGGGHARIDSRAEGGTVVSVYLPRVPAPAKKERTGSVAAVPEGRQEQILLVEDSPPLRELLARTLRKHGYRVAPAGEPSAALALAASELSHIDLLLTDVILPAMSGRALAQQLRTAFPGLRVAYMSGHDDQLLVKQGVVEKGVWLLPKPFSDQQLLVFVREALDSAQGATRP